MSEDEMWDDLRKRNERIRINKNEKTDRGLRFNNSNVNDRARQSKDFVFWNEPDN